MKSLKQYLKEDWWSDLGAEGQEAYIAAHPNSKKAKEARAEKEESKKKTKSGETDTKSTDSAKLDKAKQRQVKKFIDGFGGGEEEMDNYISIDYKGYRVDFVPQWGGENQVDDWDELEVEPIFYHDDGDEAYPDIDAPEVPDEVKKKFVEFWNQSHKQNGKKSQQEKNEKQNKLAKDEKTNEIFDIAKNLDTPADTLKELANSEKNGVRSRVAGNRNTPADTLKKLANDKEYSVRANVAENPNAPADALNKLADDDEGHIATFVAENPNTSVNTLKKLAKNKAYIVRSMVAQNPNTPVDILKRLANDKISHVRSKAAENPNTPVDILKRLANDKEYTVRMDVADNPNTPIDILKKLANDEDKIVKKYAEKNLDNKKLKEGTKMKSFKQYLKEDNFNLDSWLKELMQDSKRNYGYVDLDYVMTSLGYETSKKYSEKEIADRIKKLGFGGILKEAAIKTLNFNGEKPEVEKVRGSDLKVGDYILNWTIAPKSSLKNNEKSYMQIIDKDSDDNWVVVFPHIPNTSHKLSSKYPVYKLKESVWTDHYDKIVDLDLDRKTMSSKYKTRKDLEAAAAKAYGWNVKAEPYKTAFDKYFNESAKSIKEDSTKEALIKYAQKYGTPDEVTHIKGMTNDAAIRARYNWYLNEYGSLTEAKATHLTSIEMESTNSRLDWNFTSQGLTLGSMSGRPVTYYGDNEYRNFYNNSEQQDWTNWLKSSGQGIMKDLEKVADEFDKKVAQVLAKHGFKK